MDTRRPQFMKSKPAALLALASFAPAICRKHLARWIDPEQTAFWESRYAAAMVMEQLAVDPPPTADPHPFVEARLSKLRM